MADEKEAGDWDSATDLSDAVDDILWGTQGGLGRKFSREVLKNSILSFLGEAGGGPNPASRIIENYARGDFNTVVDCSTSGGYILASTDTLKYERNSDSCFVQGQIEISGENLPVGDLRVALPFPAANTGAQQSDRAVGTVYLAGHGGNIPGKLYARTFAGDSFFFITQVLDDGTSANINNTDVGTAFSIVVSLMYAI